MPATAVRFDALRTLGFGSISASYATVGTSFQHPMRLVKIVNNTNGDMLFSFDTVNDNIFIPAGGFTLYDISANADLQNPFTFSIGTQFYVKQSTAPTKGAVWIESFYGAGQ